MKTYVGVLMSGFPDMLRSRLDGEFVEKLISSKPQVPMSLNHGGMTVGITRALLKENNALYCEFDLIDDVPEIETGYLVPIFQSIEYYHDDIRMRVITGGVLVQVDIIVHPDNHINRIREKENHD